jgi:murein DD-endopeptidase MepM/ murein hydrolase activator NlpD
VTQPTARVAHDYRSLASEPVSTLDHARWLLIGVLAPLVIGALTFTFIDTTRKAAPDAVSLHLFEVQARPLPELPLIEPRRAPLGETVDIVVRRNDTLDRIFRQLKLDLADLAKIRELEGARERLDLLRPGDLITIVHADGLLQALKRRISDTETLQVLRSEQGFSAELVEVPLQVRRVQRHGHIDSSLFAAARSVGVGPGVIMQMANDIFGWDIDFALEIRPGDQFSVVYEQKYRDGEYLGDGRVIAAEFVNSGRSFRAVHYRSADGEVDDYFTPEGRSVRRQFLRAPVDFARISSNFNLRRMHPILNRIRAHKGVDYAAPTGTPIKAAGDGRVGVAGWKGGYGRAVILEHGGGITTLYGHMSKIAAGIRPGQRVRQGQIIGYVGATGAATGPHLHYEYRVNGVHKNPRTVPLPAAEPIPPGYLADFQVHIGPLLADLDRSKDAMMAAAESGSARSR